MKDRIKTKCYGEMFPDLSHLNINRPTEGQAFTVFVERMGIGVQRRELRVKRDEWDKCEDCPSFVGCYHLCSAKLLLWQGLQAVS